METRARVVNKCNIRKNTFRDWAHTDNHASHTLVKIWIAWNTQSMRLTKIVEMDHVIHFSVHHLESKTDFIASFVYGANDDREMRRLWRNLEYHARVNDVYPWVILGDLNVVRTTEEIIGGCNKSTQAMVEFEDFIQHADLEDLNFIGILHTWWNNRRVHSTIKNWIEI